MDRTTTEDEKNRCKEVALIDRNGEKLKCLEYDGLVLPMRFFQSEEVIHQRLSYLKNFPYQDGDVLLCSYMKTGSHWLTNILHYLLYNGDLNDMVSYPVCHIDFFDFEGEVQREDRRLLLSHFPLERLPTEHLANGGKTILLFRNPKDTVVSMFNMIQRQRIVGAFDFTWDAVLKYWQEGKIPCGSYFEYYNKWQADLQKNPNLDILIVQFEDLKRNGLNEIRRIQNYLCLNHSDERLEAVLDRCSVENLKADVDSGKVQSRLIDESGKSVLYRKGIIGDWKNHFTVAQNEIFEAVVNEKMKNSIFSYKSWNE